MHRTGILSSALLVALLALGCGATPSSTSGTHPRVKEAVDATTDAARAERDKFVNVMSKQLDELNSKYKALEQRAAEATGDAKKELDEKVKVARARRDVAAKKLDELKTASADRWEKVKDGVGSALDDLKKIFD